MHDQLIETMESRLKAIDLLVRCYDSAHREAWQDGETTAELVGAVNDFLSDLLGEAWEEHKRIVDSKRKEGLGAKDLERDL